VKRTPSKKTTDAAKPDVSAPEALAAEALASDTDTATATEVEVEGAESAAVADSPAADAGTTTSTTSSEAAAAAPPAPAKRPVRRPAARKPVVAQPVVAEAVVEETVDEKAVDEKPAAAEPLVVGPVEDAVTEEVVEDVEAAEDEAAEVEAAETGAAVAVVEAERQAEAIENVTVVENDDPREMVLKVTGLVKRFDDKTAVAGIDLEIRAGSFFGIVGPNGAGKTTTLSMVTGLLKPDAGNVVVHGADVWSDPVVAKRTMGVLPDRLRLFDRLTGAQLLYYSGILHGLEKSVVRSRSADLSAAFGLEDSLDRLVTDYSAGMTKKIAIAAAMIHSPRLLVLDEPFESVDPVSAANVIEILQKYVAAGGTVVMSSHTMNLIERICDSVAVIVNGAVLATGTMDEVRGDKSLEDRFVELAGGRKAAEGMEWLHKFSD
jgi:ABC-type multidrug transport system ATPase subunit